VEVVAHALDEVGMALDFTQLQSLSATIAQDLDHRLLNDVAPFNEVNPTAENIGAYFWTRLTADLASLRGGDRVRLRAVTISETDRSSVTYSEEEGDG
jgi:6-pyruvoyltetrahydropterin/6-carboxytetrahydropterin synthase